MIIYCAGPIKGDKTYQDSYREVIRIVETIGHTALAEFSSKLPTLIPLSDKQVYTRDLKWLDGSKLMIAEVSGPSLGVGFEIAYALFKKNIPVLAVYDDKATEVSSMITGCSDPKLQVKKYYNHEELEKFIRSFIINNEGN